MFKFKAVVICFILIICSGLLSVLSYSESYNYGEDELYEATPEQVKEYINENNITPDGSGITDLSLKDIIDSVIKLISDNIKQPLTMFGALMGIIMLTAIFGSLGDFKNNSSVTQVFSIAASLTSTIIICSYLSLASENVDGAISSASNFMLTYIPVLAGVIAIGGHASAAAIFSSVMMVSIQILTQITANVLFPLTSCLLGISAAGGINSDLKIDKLGDGLKKLIVWGLGFIMTIFIGFLTLQSSIAASADSVTLRAARFAVSNGVPFVGGAVSDALATVKTSVELLKSGIGGFGVVIGCCVLAPVLIKVLCYRFFLFLAGTVSDIFGTDDAGRMIKCGENVLSIIISMIVCMFLFITISTALMLVICRR